MKNAVVATETYCDITIIYAALNVNFNCFGLPYNNT